MQQMVRFLLIIISVLAGTYSINAQGISERARDWWVTCKDNKYCIAEVTGKAANGQTMRLKLERSNKANGKMFVTIAPEQKLEIGMRVDINIPSFDFGVFGTINKLYPGNEMTFAGDARRELITNLRKGRNGTVVVDFGGDIGKLIYEVSFVGVTDALLKMDEVQQRIGRLDAAIAWGGEPTDSLSPAREPEGDEIVGENGHEDQSGDSANRILELPDGASLELVYEVNKLPDSVSRLGFQVYECDMENAIGGFGARIYGLGDGHTLYLVPCQTGDANIEHYVAMSGPWMDGGVNYYDFEYPPDFNSDNAPLITNPEYDTTTGILTGTSYSSPNFDCGIWKKYALVAPDDYNREFFELEEYREKQNCDGKTTPPPDYELVWTLAEMGQ